MSTTESEPAVRYVDLGGGRRIKTELPLSSWQLTAHGRYRVEGVASYDEAAGRFVTKRLTIEGVDGAEVNGEALRALKAGEVVRESLVRSLRAFQGSGDPDDLEHLAELGKAGPTAETLQAVAAIYRLGLMLGDGPTQRVADALNVPRSTAGRWVTRARDRGLLTVTDPRAPGNAAVS